MQNNLILNEKYTLPFLVEINNIICNAISLLRNLLHFYPSCQGILDNAPRLNFILT